MKGWVYLITNNRMPGIVSVGYSPKDPQLRADELDHTATSPSHVVAYEILIEDPFGVEQRIHRQLSGNHEGQGRYRCSVEHAILTIKRVVGESFVYERGRSLPIAMTPQQAEAPHRQQPNDYYKHNGIRGARGQYVNVFDNNSDGERTDHTVFVENYHSHKIAVDVDEYKAGFMYEQPGLIPREFRSKQTLMRKFAFGGLLLSVAMFFFVPWWTALGVLFVALNIFPLAQRNASKGVLQAALKDPHVYQVAVEKQVFVIRGFA